jgi:Tfp pilus assembly protein PilZ
MTGEKDQRQHRRLDERSTIFIEVLAGREHSSQQESILICNSIEISAGGLRVCVDEKFESGAILQLGIELPELEEPLYVVGEVRWCKPAPQPDIGYYVGFKLLESDGTDYEIWNKLLQEMT